MAKRRPRIRELIKNFATGKVDPRYVGDGSVFMFPSQSDLGSYNVVVWLPKIPGSGEQFLCSCKGFRFSEGDSCRHVKHLREEIEAER